MGEPKRLKGRRLLPPKVTDAEQEYIKKRREAAGVGRAPDECGKNLVGLCLSGGGIRSATFCLGVMQSLFRRGVFRHIDYLSTVSGGGYIGACLSSLTTMPWGEDETAKRKRLIEEGESPLHGLRQMHHLRTHGDFLVGHQGLFRRDVLRTIGSVTLGVACTLALFVISLFVIAGALLSFGSWLGMNGLWEQVLAGDVGRVASELWPSPRGWIWLVAAVFMGGAVTVWFARRFRAPGSRHVKVHGEMVEDVVERGRLTRFALTLIGCIVATLNVAWVTWEWAFAGVGSLFLLAPAVALGSLAAGAICFILSAGHTGRSIWRFRWNLSYRSTLGAMRGVSFLILVGTLAIPGLILLITWLEGPGWEILIAGVGSLLASWASVRKGGKTDGGSGPMPRVPRYVITFAVPVLILSGIVACSVAVMPLVVWDWKVGPTILIMALSLFWVMGCIVDFNRISPHYFYRDRLTEAYLKTEGRRFPRCMNEDRRRRLETLRDDKDLKLENLHDWSREGENPYPYHLILCSLNLPGSRDLARKDQKSDHFLFSRCFVGSGTTGYVPTGVYSRGRTKLSAAMTISGAAVSSVMGTQTSFTQALAATIFNVRLGFWYTNPACYPVREDCIHPCERRIFWPRLLLKELTASTNARDFMVNLSDGGHTGDNLGLKPLLQRRARVIFVVDAEHDPDYSFGSLSTAIRQIFTEENVSVEIDRDDIRPEAGADGKRKREARAHFAIGRILYPVDGGAEAPEEGVLILIKSSYMGDAEPPVVKTYAAKNPDFPHQSTMDQFFDDDQFESYRALGSHIGDVMVDAITEANPTDGPMATPSGKWSQRVLEEFGPQFRPPPPPDSPAVERPWEHVDLLRAALLECGGDLAAAATKLGGTVGKIKYWREKFGLRNL
jgi:Patatin-like phospholipase